MTCICGDPKSKHDTGPDGRIHTGKCRHSTKFQDRPNSICECEKFTDEKNHQEVLKIQSQCKHENPIPRSWSHDNKVPIIHKCKCGKEFILAPSMDLIPYG